MELFNSDLTFPSFLEMEKSYYLKLYKKESGDISKMSRVAKVSRATIYRKMQDHFGDFRKELDDTASVGLPNR